MAGRYMPPHMRNHNSGNPKVTDTASSQSKRDPSEGYTLVEIANQLDCRHKVGTLNSNSEKGREWDHSSLAFIVLFKDQHPQWPPKIFCKTNLNLLPPSPTSTHAATETGVNSEGLSDQEGAKSSSKSIPVFTELPLKHVYGATRPEQRFLFTHFYRITSIAYLPAQSRELVEMLDTKFTPEGKKRSAEAWKASLDLRWAVVSLEQVDGGGKGEENPMVPLKEVARKSVTERLEEMRLEKEVVGESGGGDGGGKVNEVSNGERS